MARIHGRRGRVYLGITDDTSVATPLPFVAEWSIDFSTDKADVTALGDSNMVYVAGLPDASGSFSGFYDDATGQTYVAATDGLARRFYLYPTISITTSYFWGTILPDFSVDGSISGAVKIASKWNAASSILKVG